MPDLAILTESVVVAALIAGLVSLRTTSRNIKVENVIKQRQAWRDKVRDKALAVHQSAMAKPKQGARLSELQLEFRLILNPLDSEDRDILKLISDLSATEITEVMLNEFGDRVALLLKHDWERAKLETNSAPWKLFRRKKRISYEQYKRQNKRLL